MRYQQMPSGQPQDDVTAVLHDALRSTNEAIDCLTAIANDSDRSPDA